MQDRTETSNLRRLLSDRNELRSLSPQGLLKEVASALDGVRALAGDDPNINDALLQILFQPLKQVAEDLEAIKKMGDREHGSQSPKDRRGLLGRWLTTPNQSFGKAQGPSGGRRLRIRHPRRVGAWMTSGGKRKETLLALPQTISGRDFVIWNEVKGRGRPQFRAWSRQFHEPSINETRPAPAHVIDYMTGLELPRRETQTAALRLCLAYGQRRVEQPWIKVGRGTSSSWVSQTNVDALLSRRAHKKLARLLPQSFVAATIPILGPKFGVKVEATDDSELKVTWNGALLICERVEPSLWLPTSTSPRD